MDAVGDIDVPMARRAEQGGVAFGAATKAVTGGLLLGIRLRFHHHTPQQAAVGLAFEQAAADEFRPHQLSGARVEIRRQGLQNEAAINQIKARVRLRWPLINKPMSKVVLAPISIGELLDKISILEIKASKFKGKQLTNVQNELKALEEILEHSKIVISNLLRQSLKSINKDLWEIEESIRDHERENNFDSEFIKLARSVYTKNDIRADIKRKINIEQGSKFLEEKSYANNY